MFQKGDCVFVNYIDGKKYKATVERRMRNLFVIKYDSGETEKCMQQFLTRTNEVRSDISKHKKYIQKFANKKIEFGKYKDQNMTYKQILETNQEYCKAIVKGFYSVPIEFRTFCCNSFVV
jgi:hypothetical protein